MGVAAEFRAVWIPSVFNLGFPSQPGLSAEAQKAELVRLLDTAQALKLNAVLFQVRPESDALYSSPYEPWSRYLTGTQGVSPGYDPLGYLIVEAKKRGIAVHAWLNPYRAAATASKPLAANHVAKKIRPYPVETTLWFDPSQRAVQDHFIRVVLDVVTRYDIAGVHIDDYFYPYPKTPPKLPYVPDEKNYQAYRDQGGVMTKADWRRENVNQLIRRLGSSIKAVKPAVVFGVSPFGIYRIGEPATVKAGLDQYDHLFADPVKWMREGWVDYLAPQLYWADQSEQSFSTLLKWWRDPRQNPRGVPIYPGIAVDRLGGSHNWPAGEIVKQVRLARTLNAEAGTGFVFWSIRPLQNNIKGVRTALQREM